ncbi:hypothetical protein CLG96_05170 [Sphingomonas oleivorans]|uniref:Uncharacterized protein n=1 Tax=Sphingomonas oleivorans TaxID=1735121 RepID=A0A2T5G2X6_9SPHN|nr:hypothetical protein CLG96_05170 [Sphingomonas oleivorans]
MMMRMARQHRGQILLPGAKTVRWPYLLAGDRHRITHRKADNLGRIQSIQQRQELTGQQNEISRRYGKEQTDHQLHIAPERRASGRIMVYDQDADVTRGRENIGSARRHKELAGKARSG